MMGIVCFLLFVPFEVYSSSSTPVTYRKTTKPPKYNITKLEDESAPSQVYCGRQCSENDYCLSFKWTPATRVCSLYQRADVGVANQFSSDLYMRQPPLPCPGIKSRSVNGVCMCPVGQYGTLCNNTFTLNVTLQQTFFMDYDADVNQLEVDGISFIFLLAGGNGTSGTITAPGYIIIYSTDSLVSSTYTFLQKISLTTQAMRLNPFQINDNSYFVVSNKKIIGQASTTVPHILYKYDPLTQTFFELNRWSELGGGQSAVYKRPNDDVYLCIAAVNVNNSLTENPYIYKFNPLTETFQRTFSIPHTGIHKLCVFFEIDGQFYSMTSIFNSLATKFNQIYQWNPDETWSWYQDVPLTNHTGIIGIDVFVSPQLTLLAAGNVATGKVHVFNWNGTHFNFLQFFTSTGIPYYPRLVEVAGQVLLMADNNNPDASQIGVFNYNATTSQFQPYFPITADGPVGRVSQFWYNDNLYLLITNYCNSSLSVMNINHYRANQQLYQWV